MKICSKFQKFHSFLNSKLIGFDSKRNQIVKNSKNPKKIILKNREKIQKNPENL